MTDDDNQVQMSGEPMDRLTRLAAEITGGLEGEENADVKAIIMLDDGKSGGIMVHGYDDDDLTGAVTDLVMHLRALFRARGDELEFISIPNSPEGL